MHDVAAVDQGEYLVGAVRDGQHADVTIKLFDPGFA